MLIPGPGFESIHRIRSTYLKLFRRKLDSANSSLIDYTKFCATLNKVKILANHQCWTKPSLLFYFSLYSFWKQTKKKKSLIKWLIRQVFWVFSITLMQFKHFIIPVNIILHITILCINCHLQQIHESLDIIFLCTKVFKNSFSVVKAAISIYSLQGPNPNGAFDINLTILEAKKQLPMS